MRDLLTLMRSGVVFVLLGLAALLAAHFGAPEAWRSAAVVLLVAGATAVGIAIGKKRALTSFPKLAVVSARSAGFVAIAIVIVPTLIVFASVTAAALSQIASAQSVDATGSLVVGALIALLLFGGTAFTALLTIRSLRTKAPASSKETMP